MHSFHNAILLLLAISLVRALPQAEIQQRVDTNYPVITFADYKKGSWNDWDWRKTSDIEKDLSPRTYTVKVLDAVLPFEVGRSKCPQQIQFTKNLCLYNQATDDNGEPFAQLPVLWKGHIPKGKNCVFGIEGTNIPQNLNGYFNVTDRFMNGYVVNNVRCYLDVTSTITYHLTYPTPAV